MCWCGDTFGRYGQTDKCDKLCPGTDTETCGGDEASEILVTEGELVTYSHIGDFKGKC